MNAVAQYTKNGNTISRRSFNSINNNEWKKWIGMSGGSAQWAVASSQSPVASSQSAVGSSQLAVVARLQGKLL